MVTGIAKQLGVASRARRDWRRPHAGFTLVELLVVIAIIGILIATLFPAFSSTQEAARGLQCKLNLTKIGLALDAYAASHEGLPSGSIAERGPVLNRAAGAPLSWTTRILPQLDLVSLFDQIDHDARVDDEANALAHATSVAVYTCPSDASSGMTVPHSSYAGSHHPEESPIDTTNQGLLFLNSRVRLDEIPDGRSQTLIVGEKLSDARDLGWMSGTRATLRNTGHSIRTSADPKNEPDDDNPGGNLGDDLFVGGFGSYHPGRSAHFLFADGSVQSLEGAMDLQLFQSLADRSDGTPLSWP